MTKTMDPLKIELLRGEPARQLLADMAFRNQWSSLCDRCPWSTTFQLPGYVCTWYEIYRDSFEPVLLFSINANSELNGLLTLAITPANRLVAAGDVQAEYQTWVCPPELGDTFPLQAMHEIHRQFPTAILRLNYLPAGTPTAWLTRAPAKSLHLLQSHRRPLTRFGDGSEITASLAKRTNKNRLRQIEKLGHVEFEQITDPHQMEAIIDSMIPLHDARHLTFRGSAPFMEGQIHKSFALALMKIHGLLHVTLLKAGEHLVAAHLGAINKKEVQLGLTAYNPRFAHHSPGKFHILFLSRMLMQQGFEQLDLTAGGDPYKERFADAWDQVHTLTLFPSRASRARGAIIAAIKTAAKSTIKFLRISPNQIRLFVGKIKSFNPLNFAASILRRSRRWIASNDETRIYSYPAATALKLNIPSALRCDAVADLLQYQPVKGASSRRDFVATAINHLEEGRHLYTRAENGRLLHCACLAHRPAEELTTQLFPAYTFPSDTALIVNLQSMAEDRAADLNCLSLKTMLRAAAEFPQTQTILIAVSNDNPALRKQVEETGFIYEGSIFSKTRLGRKTSQADILPTRQQSTPPPPPRKTPKREFTKSHS